MNNRAPMQIPAWTADDPWPEGDELLIVGPPGTGKTHSVLTRYVWPALDRGERVLVTSYTKAAAKELRERTAAQTGEDPAELRATMSTIHSEAARRCKHLGLEFGRDKAADEGEDDEQDMTAVHARIESKAAQEGLDLWEKVRHAHPEDRGLSIEGRLGRLGLHPHRLQSAAAAVRMDLRKRYGDDGRMVRPDFTGLLELALDRGAGRDLDLLCVDEAQDCTPLEWALIDLWAASARRVLIVGDPDQSIYGWSGADGRRLLRWIRSGRPVRRLAQSYRVPRAAYRVARSVVCRIADREDAPYLPRDHEGEVRSVTEAGAMDAVADIVPRLAPDDAPVLLLGRKRATCAHMVEALTLAGIPHIAERGGSLLGTPSKPSRLYRICTALSQIAQAAGQVYTADARALVAALRGNGPGFAGPRGVKGRLGKALRGTRRRIPMSELHMGGLNIAGLAAMWTAAGTEGTREAREGRQWLNDAFLASQMDLDRALVLREWLREHGDSLLSVAGRVVVTTCHASKGRQSRLVVIDARGGWPAWGGKGTQESREEDRRVLYVSLTRTLDRCLVIRAFGGRDWLIQQGVNL